MVWSTKSKDISIIAPTTPHASSQPNVVGRAPGVSTITYTPSDFFGAAARCLHLHVINPALATPESRVISALVEQHVDDTSNDFAVLPTADRFKDYARSYFSGTVAAGVAYLMMIRDGYVWTDHFENEKKSGPGKGSPTATRSPDFVFARSGHSDVALVESKGTRSDTQKAFDSTVEDGYIGQVEPHLGFSIGTSLATHGYSVGAWMTSSTKAELNIHHTDLVVATPSPATGPGTITSVQQGNYATALQLSHSSRLGTQVRDGRIDDDTIRFLEFSWLGREWLASPEYFAIANYEMVIGPEGYYWLSFGRYAIALEKQITEEVLRTLSRGTAALDVRFELNPMSPELMAQAREDGGTVFPDGLAITTNKDHVKPMRMVEWQRKLSKIVTR